VGYALGMAAIAYEGRGTSGPPLVLVHGFPMHRAMWRGQLADLGASARVVAIDLPGFGDSAPPDADVLGMEDLATAVLAVADALGLERFVLGGLSMGGYVALAAARRYPGRLSGLVLLDTRAEPDAEAAREGRHADAARVLSEGTGFFIEKMRPMWVAPDTAPEITGELEAMARAAAPASVAAGLRGLAARPDARPHLGRIEVPTLVISGRDDRVTPPDVMRPMADEIPGATFVEVPGGHFSPLERPGEVNAALAAFLNRL
jgi:3-oxoadipate enol-lactonase